MNKEQFSAILPLIVSGIVERMQNDNKDFSSKDLIKFYNSKLYQALQNEDTKFWHYSSLTLYEMFKEEIINGTFIKPEEAA